MMKYLDWALNLGIVLCVERN